MDDSHAADDPTEPAEPVAAAAVLEPAALAEPLAQPVVQPVVQQPAPVATADTTCSICLEDLRVPVFQAPAQSADSGAAPVAVSGTEATYTMTCGHTFHVRCIVPALRRSTQCPNCRTVEPMPGDSHDSQDSADVSPWAPMPLVRSMQYTQSAWGLRRLFNDDDDGATWHTIGDTPSASRDIDHTATGSSAGRVRVTVAPAPAPPRERPPPPPPLDVPTAPTVVSVVQLPAPTSAVLRARDAVIVLGDVTVEPSSLPRRRVRQPFLTLRLRVPQAALGAMAVLHPQATEVMVSDNGELHTNLVTVTAVFNNGDAMDTALTWTQDDEGWRRSRIADVTGDLCAAVVLSGGNLKLRAVAAAGRGDAFVAALEDAARVTQARPVAVVAAAAPLHAGLGALYNEQVRAREERETAHRSVAGHWVCASL